DLGPALDRRELSLTCAQELVSEDARDTVRLEDILDVTRNRYRLSGVDANHVPPPCSLPPPLRPRTRPVVAERVVALAHRLPESGRAGTRDEVEPLLRVARDAVEERAERAAGREPHVLGGLIAEELQHDELARRHLCHAAR